MNRKVLEDYISIKCIPRVLNSALCELHIESSLEAATPPIEPSTCSSWTVKYAQAEWKQKRPPMSNHPHE
jgi:hypothetical protein